MRRFILLLFLLIISFPGFTQNFTEEKTDSERLNLIGKVKSINQFAHQAIVYKDGKIAKGIKTRILNGEISSQDLFETSHFIFDKKHKNIIKKTINNERFKYTTSNSYNKNGNKTEEVMKTHYKYANKKIKYFYDKNNNIQEIIEFDHKDNITHEIKFDYHEKERIVEETTTVDSNPVKIFKQYDERGKVEKEIRFNSNGEIFRTTAYKYSEDNLIEAVHYNSENKLSRRLTFTYNEKGVMYLIRIHNINDELYFELEYRYEYDRKGNWIENIIYENRVPKYIVQRKIQYF